MLLIWVIIIKKNVFTYNVYLDYVVFFFQNYTSIVVFIIYQVRIATLLVVVAIQAIFTLKFNLNTL